MTARRPPPAPSAPSGAPRPGLRRRDLGRLALGLALSLPLAETGCQPRRGYYAVDYYFIPF